MPELTVVVPALAKSDHLRRCLDSLAAQTLAAHRFEVVVTLADDSDAHRAEVAARVAVQLDGISSGPEVVLVAADGTTRAAARNAALARARGAWTTFVAEKDFVGPDYLELLLASAAPDRVAAARVVDVEPDGSLPPGRAPSVVTDLELASSVGAKVYPTSWLLETPFVPSLRHDEDSVLTAHLFGTFERQFSGYDLTPARRGAAYFRSPTPTGTRDLGSRLAVVEQLRTAEPTELVDSLVRQQLGRARSPWAALTTPPRITHPLVVVAGDARSVNAHAGALRLLTQAGYAVRVLHLRGRLADPLRSSHTTHRLAVLPADLPAIEPATASVVSRLLPAEPDRDGQAARANRAGRAARRLTREGLRITRRLAPEVLPARVAAAGAARTDEPATALLHGPRELFVLDAAGDRVVDRLAGRRSGRGERPGDRHRDGRGDGRGGRRSHRRDGGPELAALTLEVAASRTGFSRAEALGLRQASQVLRDAEATGDERSPAALWTGAAYRLVRAGRRAAATQLLDDCLAVAGPAEAEAAGHGALEALIRIDEDGAAAPTLSGEPADVPGVVATCLRHADDALASGDLDRVTFLATIALDLLFARVLHTAAPSSPIVARPTSFLAPLRSSQVGQLLSPVIDPPPERQAAARERTPERPRASARPRVTVLPGAYPKFAGAVVRELEGHAAVEVLDLAARDRRYGNTAVDPVTVRERVAARSAGRPTLDAATAAVLDTDVLFVDWADKGLSLATEHVPDRTRVVVRLHGVDTLSAWLHTARWERVDDAIFPSEHLRLATERALGGRLDGVRQHVVANPVDVGRYALPKLEGAEHTLGMVGWGQQVKDPCWTLDLLERLRAEDDRWRLLLVGTDFPLSSGNGVESRAAERFRSRLLSGGTGGTGGSGLVEAVDFVGYTRSLPEVLQRVGWGVSSSRREGFHIGLVEMAASGAVPVVRDWPVYAEIGGARGLFPDDWVARDAGSAAERVLDLSGRGGWAVAGTEAAAVAAERFAGSTSGDQLRRIILG
ncbi:glycosyl transferase family 1 [Humibacillus xanthopallidus]|uniref:Glycosyl transferase family 1 n=1 Tax=Humibacillus xanthopallidus TaxID=412689 RepID=A0A543PP98_9MICO|nr:glycosyltransferase [Humibacillus xanthopallidus]TQN45900.1 glycosyl transferase family 1 [Humibacillus xanthopallidus]